MLVKLLGLIDIGASIMLFALLFGLSPLASISLFFGGVLFMKSLFLFMGDVLSIFDLLAAILFFMSLITTPWIFITWVASLVLMTKGIASFF